MISVMLDNVNVGVDEAKGPNGESVLIIVAVDQASGIQWRLPLDEVSARQLASRLSGKPTIQVAKSLPGA